MDLLFTKLLITDILMKVHLTLLLLVIALDKSLC